MKFEKVRKISRLEVIPEYYGRVLQLFFRNPFQPFEDNAVLFCLICAAEALYRFAFTPESCNFLRKAIPVLLYDKTGSPDNRPAASIIDRETDDGSIGVIFQKIPENARRCTAKTIDGLIVISHHEEVSAAFCPLSVSREEFYRLVLLRADVLKFIYKKVTEALLPPLADGAIAFEKLAAAQNHVLEVDEAIFPKEEIIFRRNAADRVFTPEKTQGRKIERICLKRFRGAGFNESDTARGRSDAVLRVGGEQVLVCENDMTDQ